MIQGLSIVISKMNLLSNITIAPKLAIMLSLPILGLGFFSSQSIRQDWRGIQEMSAVEASVGLTVELSDLVYCLQKERGLSLAYAVSEDALFKEELVMAKNDTDGALSGWKACLSAAETESLSAEAQTTLLTSAAKLESLASFRSAAAQLGLRPESIFENYSQIIGAQMDAIHQLSAHASDPSVESRMMALQSLLKVIESQGEERAIVTASLIAGLPDNVQRESLRELTATARAHEITFSEFAKSEWQESLANNNNRSEARLASATVQSILALEQTGTESLKANEYWDAKTSVIEGIRSIRDEIRSELIKVSESVRIEKLRAFQWEFALTTLLLLSALGISFSVGRGIRNRLRDAMKITELVASGNLTAESDCLGSDETAQVMKGLHLMTASLRDLIGQVKVSEGKVTSGAKEFGTLTSELRATVIQQDATTHEIVATSNQISATSVELLRSIREVSESAEKTASTALESLESLDELGSSMQGISAASGLVVDRLSELNEKAGNINLVTSLIAKVADQTNLLSLNAAIEAEKAGEYGSGFSVVATEIRRLADQTAVAVLEIEQTVKEIQAAVSAGVMSMDQFSMQARTGIEKAGDVSERLKVVISKVECMPAQFRSVEESMEFQSTGAQQISEAMAQLGETSRHTRESVELSSEATVGLEEAVAELNAGVSHFQVEA